MDIHRIKNNVQSLADQFASNRSERQQRRELFREDFDQLKDTGFLLSGVLAEQGGLWKNAPESTRDICDLLRILAHGDSSVALVSSMHPGVLAFWNASPHADSAYDKQWQEQRNFCSQTAIEGHFWGTITSEPGSGGDILNTKTQAQRHGPNYAISGIKHFGSGSGIASYMITTAVPSDENLPDGFFMDMRDAPWDGSTGIKLLFPWNGHGMIATQSHSMEFEGFPATRIAWPGNISNLGAAAGGFIACLFTAVIVGIVEIAIETARQNLEKRHDSMRPYEQVEWTRVEIEGWLIQQGYEGMLRSVEEDRETAGRETLLGKTAVAELAESVMTRLCKVMGGGTYSRHSPFGFWFQDVRALGFLRPPWVLAYDQLFAGAWPSD